MQCDMRRYRGIDCDPGVRHRDDSRERAVARDNSTTCRESKPLNLLFAALMRADHIAQSIGAPKPSVGKVGE